MPEAKAVVAADSDSVKRKSPANFRNLTGQIFGRLTVESRAENATFPNGRYSVRWNCVCICGQRTKVQSIALTSGTTKSCGCLQHESRNIKHGCAGRSERSKTYSVYYAMLQRCYKPNCNRWPRYGGRGITVCQRWIDSFENFLADMGECPPGLTLERKDNDGNYERSNCKWATRKEGARNTSRSRKLIIDGEELTAIEWSERSGLSYQTLLNRLNSGWDAKRAVFEPVHQTRS